MLMSKSEAKFAQLLTEGIHRIRIREEKTVRTVQDELGYRMGRDGGSSIEYWRKGHIPLRASEVINLAREIVKRGHLEREWLEQFLQSAGYPGTAELVDELFAFTPAPTAIIAQGSNNGCQELNSAGDQNAPPHHDPIWKVAPHHLTPFVVGPPIIHPRQFFGREYELRRLFSLLQHFPLQNAAIIGPHRSGKTSLLHYLKSITTMPVSQVRAGQRTNWLPKPEQYTWIFIDFQDARMRSLEFLLRAILTKLKLPVPAPCDLPNFMETVSHRVLTPTVVLMDEIGAGLASPELDQHFWWSLRSLCSNLTDGNLAIILTAHDKLERVIDQSDNRLPFFDIIGHTLALSPLTHSEALDLIANASQPFTPQDRDWIIEHSGRWPALLQILCHTRLTALDEGNADDTWREEGLYRLVPYRYLMEQQS